jgi:hypothetical protein
MATDTILIQGEVTDHSTPIDTDVEKLLIGFLRALLSEQNSDEQKVDTCRTN